MGNLVKSANKMLSDKEVVITMVVIFGLLIGANIIFNEKLRKKLAAEFKSKSEEKTSNE